MKHFLSFILFHFLLFSITSAQFSTLGDASAIGGTCYNITPALSDQEGAVWNQTPLDFGQAFELYTRVSFGTEDLLGADGIAMVFQTLGTAVPPSTGGFRMGAGGITPSLIVEMDTWQNVGSGDPLEDHLAILRDGNNDHAGPANLAGPISILPGGANIEDGAYHDLRISWDPGTQIFTVNIDCGATSLSYTGDLINTVFGGNTNITWGFSSATAARQNEHNMCFDDLIFPQRNNLFLCGGDTTVLTATPGFAYSWSPATGLSDPTIQNPEAFPATTTTYVATVTDNCGLTFVDTFRVEVLPAAQLVIDLGADTSLCMGQNLTLDAYRPGPTYLWQDGSTDSVLQVTTSGIYWVELTNVCGSSRDSIEVTVFDVPPPIDFGSDTILCQGDTLLLETNATGFDHVWQDNSAGTSFEVTIPGTYWVEVSNICGIERDSITADFIPLPDINLGNDTLLCEGDSIVLDATWAGATYLWNDGFTDPIRTITQPAGYVVTVSNACADLDFGIVVDFQPAPQPFTLGADTTLCEGETLLLSTNQSGFDYFWQDGSTNMDFTVISPGTYFLQISSACALEMDEINVSYSPLPEVNLGPDQLVCEEDLGSNSNLVFQLKPAPGVSYRWVDGSTDPSFVVQEGGLISVEAQNQCGIGTDTVLVLTELCNCSVHVPSAFTPNFDGVNDLFTVVPYCNIQSASLKIFDRWGRLMFETDDPDVAWDGTCNDAYCAEGVYMWVYEYIFPDRNNEMVKTQKAGTVTLFK